MDEGCKPTQTKFQNPSQPKVPRGLDRGDWIQRRTQDLKARYTLCIRANRTEVIQRRQLPYPIHKKEGCLPQSNLLNKLISLKCPSTFISLSSIPIITQKLHKITNCDDQKDRLFGISRDNDPHYKSITPLNY